MIYTSYYSNHNKYIGKHVYNIMLHPPRGSVLMNAYELMPSPDIENAISKGEISVEEFCKKYLEQISKLNPAKIAKKYDNAVLVGYTADPEKCERSIVARWLREAGYECEEIE